MRSQLPIPPLPGDVPQELKERDQWVTWKYKLTDKGKLTKVPLQTTGVGASTTNPSHWTSYDNAYRNAQQNNRGVGYLFSKDDTYTGIDLDDCRDRETGDIQSWPRAIIDRLGSSPKFIPRCRLVPSRAHISR